MYKLVIAGGTFDLLHTGHKTFLQNILSQTSHLILGLTSDKYIFENKMGVMESYETRKNNLENFLSSIGKKDCVEIISIDDFYGNLLNPDINPDAVAVTDQTKDSMEKINYKRKELGLPSLKSITIPMKIAQDGSEISSTKIRTGEINREGKLYFDPSWKGKNFVLPENLREELSKPFGEILENIPDDLFGEKTITVGDVTTKQFNEKGVNQFLSIIDFKVHREKKFNSIEDLNFSDDITTLEVKSEKGLVSSSLFEAVKEAFFTGKKTVVIIDGEDDLSVLVCLILSPIGYAVFYGQPNEGLVEVKVTEENKEKAYRLLKQFVIL